MILESAVLNIRAGSESAFEAAMAEALPIMKAAEGFAGVEIRRCLEQPSRYLLLVKWARLEDHTEGFRNSPGYRRWRALLHGFYEPFPVVEHYGPPLFPAT